MSLNAKIAKIPYFLLYLILVGFTATNWIKVILFQKDWSLFQARQPWDYWLASLFSRAFGLPLQQYFLIALPLVLLGLYFLPKLIGKLINLDKSTNIKGDNHAAVIFLLLIIPPSLGLSAPFDSGWQSYLAPGLILIALFSFWSWLDERSQRS